MTVQLTPTTVERNWAMAAHLSALVAVAGLPFGHIIGPLVVYLAKSKESPYVGEHARASLNYQITISVLIIVALVIAVVGIFGAAAGAATSSNTGAAFGGGLIALWVALGGAIVLLLLLSIIFIVLATVAASEGRPYTYPFAIRFLR